MLYDKNWLNLTPDSQCPGSHENLAICNKRYRLQKAKLRKSSNRTISWTSPSLLRPVVLFDGPDRAPASGPNGGSIKCGAWWMKEPTSTLPVFFDFIPHRRWRFWLCPNDASYYIRY
jgi:hypothetical protein